MSVELCSSLKSLDFYENLKSSLNSYGFSQDDVVTVSFQKNILQIESSAFSKVFCDFTDKKFIKEVKQSYGRSEGVFGFLNKKAKQKSRLKICDLTVGMGKDFFKFILAGHDVVGFERNPLFYYLVKDGVRRFLDSKESKDLKSLFKVDQFLIDLRMGEASVESDQFDQFDLFYYDPMFEDQSKKAAPKKGMQALKCLALPSTEDEKTNLIKDLKRVENAFIYKCSKKPKDFPFTVQKEIKGKGFSYLIL